jgi:transketolase
MLSEGTDVTIVATGHLVWEALIAAEALEAESLK